MRWVVLGLALANAVVFGWWQGWLDPLWPAPYAQEREPERSRQQIQPDRIRLLDDAAAERARRPSAAASAASAGDSAASAAATPAAPGAAAAAAPRAAPAAAKAPPPRNR